MHGRRGQWSSEPVPGRHPLCDRRARGPYLLAISRISRWPQDRFAGRSGGADKIPQRFRQARKEPQRRPKKIVSAMEQRRVSGIDLTRRVACPPAPQPLTHPAKDPGPPWLQGLLFLAKLPAQAKPQDFLG